MSVLRFPYIRRDSGIEKGKHHGHHRNPAVSEISEFWVASAFILTGSDLIGGLFFGVIGGIAAAIFFARNTEDNQEFAVGPPPGIFPSSGGGIRDFVRWFDETPDVTANPLTLKASWRSAMIRAVVSAPLLAILFGFAVGGFVVALADNPFKVSTLEAGGFLGLVIAVAAIPACALTATPTWPTSLTFVQLRFTQHTPLRLMRFFEDAYERGVLRTVGPVYQFRHVRLRDRLAEQASPPISTNETSQTVVPDTSLVMGCSHGSPLEAQIRSA
jgi:hypothetical protein